jgi:hypothetical protein
MDQFSVIQVSILMDQSLAPQQIPLDLVEDLHQEMPQVIVAVAVAALRQ